jgi:hypothetical protein
VITAADWGFIGSLEKAAKKAWREQGIDITADQAVDHADTLKEMTERMLGRNPKGGRPNKHSEKTFRSNRPRCEHLMPHGLDNWHRPTEDYGDGINGIEDAEHIIEVRAGLMSPCQ